MNLWVTDYWQISLQKNYELTLQLIILKSTKSLPPHQHIVFSDFVISYQLKYVKGHLIFFFFLVFLPFLGPLPRHMEVPRLGV